MRKYTSLWLAFLSVLLLAGCGGTEAYSETFDEPGDWRVESNSDVEGEIRDGVYDFIVKADDQLFWTNPGLNFSDGLYEVEATQIDGPLNNAYGMLFRLDDEESNFYAFQISGDGYVWIGRYYNGVPENEALINDWWFVSDAIHQGLNVTNTLAVRAEGANMIFYVNGVEVGRVTDDAFSSGDIGLLVRTLGLGGVHIQFDNFTVTPLEN